ncbi:hypothetical protein UUU_31410 [Klebsiella pneumoniae subsp. pneumoniae DSM 30104 = JCM 1662 = NBRC 14940]|nr:hypothetical protein UUU_31410 [Klebsiella pneumoniae subsp. pneumoniae DSM 30104 = JCM 1662 = NBRC 14940]
MHQFGNNYPNTVDLFLACCKITVTTTRVRQELWRSLLASKRQRQD